MSSGIKCPAFVFFAILFIATAVCAMQVDISSQELFPGDPFVIKVSGTTSGQKVSAFIGGREILFSSCGDACLIGIGLVDPNAEPGESIVTTQTGTEKLFTSLSIIKANYPEQRLKLPDRQVTLSPEDRNRVNKEAVKLNNIWQHNTARLFEGAFIIPLPNPVSTVYGARRIFNNKTVSIHGGIDIRGSRGEEVKASNRGRVILAENLFFGGNTLIIDHGLGIYTVYMHLDRFAALNGNLVSKGDLIGYVGSSGRSTGPHLHFGVKIMAANANPLSLIKLNIE